MKKAAISLLDRNGEVAAAFYAVTREGDKLILDTKALDVMRLDMVITPSQVLRVIKVVFSWPVMSFLLLLPYFGLKQLVGSKSSKS
jgi:hypothetical protein